MIITLRNIHEEFIQGEVQDTPLNPYYVNTDGVKLMSVERDDNICGDSYFWVYIYYRCGPCVYFLMRGRQYMEELKSELSQLGTLCVSTRSDIKHGQTTYRF
jgi:hypothetical protein